jgi:Domain of unknown function (DUF4265)
MASRKWRADMTEQWARILFDLDPSDWHRTAGETMWAVPIAGSEWRHFRLMNSPFNACGVSYEDIVRATPIEHSEVFHFEEVVERGGHSTYMLIMKADDRRVSAYWNLLEKIGCTYEGTHTNLDGEQRPLYSVDVPPSTDLYEVYEILERGEKDAVWIFQEGYAYLPKA